VSSYTTESVPRGRVRRHRGGWVTLLAILLVLGAILVVADRAAARAASRELQDQVAQELVSHDVSYSTLDVTIGGVPFLTQVAEGRYDEITIDVTDVRLPPDAAQGATLSSLHVVATQVNADAAELVQGTAKVTADQVTGTAVVSYQTLTNLLDLSNYSLSDVTFTEDRGGLRAEAKATVAGLTVPISAVADVTVVDGAIQVRLRDAAAVGIEVPQVAKNYLADLVNRSITARLPQLPFGLVLNSLTPTANGLAIAATGHEVPLVR
jgi:hypothetical protein